MKIKITIEKYSHPNALPGLDTKVTLMTKRGGISVTCHGKDEALAKAADWLTRLDEIVSEKGMCEHCGAPQEGDNA